MPHLLNRFFGPALPSHLEQEFHDQHMPMVHRAFVVLVPICLMATIALHHLNPLVLPQFGKHFKDTTFQALMAMLALSWLWMMIAKPKQTFTLAGVTMLAVAYAVMIYLNESRPELVKWQAPQFMIWQLALSPLVLRATTFLATVLLALAAPIIAMSQVHVSATVWWVLVTYLLALSALSAIVFRASNRMRREAFLARLSLQHEAFRDGLTGALNRKRFFQLATPLMETFAEKQQPMSACFMDLDNFKRINDQNGHVAGDVVLAAFAQLTKKVYKSVRSEHKLLFARLGGEEFVLLLPGYVREHAIDMAQAICDATRAARPGNHALTVSIGVAEAMPGESAGSLVHRADLAMLRAKSAGKDRVTFTPAALPEAEQPLAASTR